MTGDHEYYYRRAERELEMAQRSDQPKAVKVHYDLANLYLDQIVPNGAGGLQREPRR